jgi:hypothetical protein
MGCCKANSIVARPLCGFPFGQAVRGLAPEAGVEPGRAQCGADSLDCLLVAAFTGQFAGNHPVRLAVAGIDAKGLATPIRERADFVDEQAEPRKLPAGRRVFRFELDRLLVSVNRFADFVASGVGARQGEPLLSVHFRAKGHSFLRTVHG